jgi:putative ABC transport system permease protein
MYIEVTLLFSLIVAVMLLSIIMLAFKNQVLFKMGVRNFSRRPKETTIVVAGLLVSTAIISGSFVAGDTVNYMIEKATYDSLGTVDEMVTAGSQNFFNYTVFSTLVSDVNLTSRIGGISPAITANIPSIDDVTSGITAANVQLHGVNFTLDTALGGFTLVDGTYTNATDLGANETLINSKLAAEINAHVGDMLIVNYMTPSNTFSAHNFTIKYIAQDVGKAQYGLRKALFIPLDEAQALVQKPEQINEIKISNTGNVESGVFKSDDVVRAAKQSLIDAPSCFEVTPMKSDLLTQAHDASAQMSSLFIMMSIFSTIAGVMLIINIFVMLAEERKSELGMARAVGMQRRHLIQMFMFEGITYSVLAAAIGSILGLGTGAGLVNGFNAIFMGSERANGVFMSGEPTSQLPLVLYYNASSLFNAFLLGVIITFATIALASYLISKLNIVKAIRNVKEPEQSRPTRRMMLLGVFLFLFGVASFATANSQNVIKVLSPPMAIFGTALISRRFIWREWIFSIAGIAVVTYVLYITLSIVDMQFSDAALFFVLGGLLLVAGVVFIVVFNSNLLLRGLSGTLGRIKSLQAVLKPSIAYPLNKKFRMGMTVLMFALVMFVIVLGSVIAATYQPDVMRGGGGYDVRALSIAPLANLTAIQPSSISGSVVGQPTAPPPQDPSAPSTPFSTNVTPLDASTLTYYDGLYVTRARGITISRIIDNNLAPQLQGPARDFIYGVDANFTAHTTYTFSEKASGLNSTEDVWRALNDPHNVVVDSLYQYGNSFGVKAGDTVTIPTAAGTSTFTIVGVLDETYLQGIFMNKSVMEQLFPNVKGDTLFLIKVAKGTKPLDVTYDLKRGYKAFGMDANVVRDEVEQMNNQTQMMVELLMIFLGLGLIIGIASLGAITLRSIMERRRDIGMMRAMGFQQNQILSFLLIEVLFSISLAGLIGLGTGVALSYAIYLSFTQISKVPFTIPIVQLATVLAVVYVAAIICTIVPARNASKIPPAEAVRYIE